MLVKDVTSSLGRQDGVTAPRPPSQGHSVSASEKKIQSEMESAGAGSGCDFKDGKQDLSERPTIGLRKAPQSTNHQNTIQGEEDRLQGRRLQEAGLIPVGNLDLTNPARRTDLAGHRHQDHVRSPPVVRGGADHDGRSFFAACLICEGKWDEDDVTEAISGHIRRRRGCPRPSAGHLRRAGQRLA